MSKKTWRALNVVRFNFALTVERRDFKIAFTRMNNIVINIQQGTNKSL